MAKQVEISLYGQAPVNVALSQQGRNRFTVRYFKQVKARLTYEQACVELGACILHALACDSKIDNREPGEE